MTKNITVIDRNENILYSTYPKRAKGLVKRGRAEWIDDTAIRLCTAHNNEEETKMAVNIYEVFDNQISKMQEQLRDEESEFAVTVRLQILKTMELFEALEQKSRAIELIVKQLDKMQDSLTEDQQGSENQAARETTRQKMLELMEEVLKTESSFAEFQIMLKDKE